MSDKATPEGQRLIEAWIRALDAVARAKVALGQAEAALDFSAAKLAEWMLPDDVAVGEKIALWHGDSLIQVEVTNGDPVITIRTRGRSVDPTRMVS